MEATDMTRSDYSNGYRFGMAYGHNHGVRSLAKAVRGWADDAYISKPPTAEYIAGATDAALALVQMRGAR
jgi:hypothetical protein